jgi:leader peptidase (prepilin peptidase) / N-methyltransferase
MIYFFLTILGLIIGSFLNAVIYRLHTKESIVKERSHCPHCGHILSPGELLPIISFAIQKGRCRNCRKAISIQYPIVEASTALFFLFIYWWVFTYNAVFDCTNFWECFFVVLFMGYIVSALTVIFVYDLRHYLIPDKVLFPMMGITVGYRLIELFMFGSNTGIVENLYSFLTFFLSAVGSMLFFAIIFFVSKGRAMGFGDVKYAFFMGFFLGWPNILAGSFLAWIFGGIIGVGLLLSGKKNMKSPVPFAPFLIAGTLLALFFGQELIDFYITLISV